MINQLKRSKAGFTLIELIIVIAILAILAAILLPLMIGYINEAKQSVADANARTVYSSAASAAAILLSQSKTIAAATYASTATDDYTAKVKELLGDNFTKTGTSWSVIVTGTGSDLAFSTTWTDGVTSGTYAP